jgi:carboxyl-terminal processing protease
LGDDLFPTSLRDDNAVPVIGIRIAIPVAAYYTWNGTFLEGKGVAPDVGAPFSASAIRDGCDALLQRATDIAKGL